MIVKHRIVITRFKQEGPTFPRQLQSLQAPRAKLDEAPFNEQVDNLGLRMECPSID